MLRHRINVGRHHIQRIGPVGLFNYSDYLQATYPQLDRLDFQDPSGSAAAWNASANLPDAAHTATVVGVPTNFGNLGLGVTYNGATAFTNYYSAALNTKFNNAAGVIINWAKVANVGVWTDGNFNVFSTLATDTNNRIHQQKPNTNNTLLSRYEAGGADKNRSIGGQTTVDWFMQAITWDTAANGGLGEVKVFLDAIQQGATLTNLGVWGGPLNAAQCILGAINTTPASALNGSLARFMLGYAALAQPQLLDIYQKGAGI